ncbi:MAG: hypothetical protein NTY67_09575 [Cyanobacteria bacterium]|nr:hypothetical protein [Cyanobacteriota bacterium]
MHRIAAPLPRHCQRNQRYQQGQCPLLRQRHPGSGHPGSGQRGSGQRGS